MEVSGRISESMRKNRLREEVWKKVDRFVSGPKPVQGRIPNFQGARSAAERLVNTLEFQNAQVVKVHPSLNAIPFREQVLRLGKTLIVPPLPGHDFLYFRVDPESVKNKRYNWAAQKRGFNRIGVPLQLEDIPNIDMFVVAATVVSPEGCRAGKGKGYGEVEWGIASELGVVDSSTVVATLVHDVQVVSPEQFPFEMMESHDLPVDLIATPNRIIHCQCNQNEQMISKTEPVFSTSKLRKPKGIIWEKIDHQMFEDIGALKALKLKLSKE